MRAASSTPRPPPRRRTCCDLICRLAHGLGGCQPLRRWHRGTSPDDARSAPANAVTLKRHRPVALTLRRAECFESTGACGKSLRAADCAASPRIRVWFASHSSTGLCVDFGSKRIRFALRSSAFDIHYLPVDSSVSPFGCRAAPRCVNRHCRRPNNSQLLQFSMIAAMQSLDSGLATDRRIHSISLIQPGSPWSAGFGSVWLACE